MYEIPIFHVHHCDLYQNSEAHYEVWPNYCCVGLDRGSEEIPKVISYPNSYALRTCPSDFFGDAHVQFDLALHASLEKIVTAFDWQLSKRD